MRETKVLTLVLSVENRFGVLTRITTLIRREGFNIKSITAAESKLSNISKITIDIECVEVLMPSIVEKLLSMISIKDVQVYEPLSHLRRELLVFRVLSGEEGPAVSLALSYGARQIEPGIYEISASPTDINDVMEKMSAVAEISFSRSGSLLFERSGV